MNEIQQEIKELDALIWYYEKRVGQEWVDDAKATLQAANLVFDVAMEDHKEAPSKIAAVKQKMAIARKRLKMDPLKKKIAELKKLHENLSD